MLRPVRRPLPARPLQFIEFYLEQPITLIDWNTGARSIPPGRVVVVGNQTQRLHDIEIHGRYRVFTMHFVPSGLHRLLGLSGTELTDNAIDAVELFGRAIESLCDRLASASTHAQRIALAEGFIADRVHRARPWTAFDETAIAIKRHGNVDLPTLVRYSGLSRRQFERRFSTAVGMSPATYAKVSRFHLAIERKENEPDTRWSAIAADLGYYDQAHLVRDVKALAGESGSRLVEQSLAIEETLIEMAHFSYPVTTGADII